MKQIDEFQRKVEELCSQAKVALMFCGNGENRDGFGVNISSVKANIGVAEQLIKKLEEEKYRLYCLEYEECQNGVNYVVRDNYCLKKDKIDILYLRQRLFDLYKEYFINNSSKNNKENRIIDVEIESLIKIINALK